MSMTSQHRFRFEALAAVNKPNVTFIFSSSISVTNPQQFYPSNPHSCQHVGDC